MLNEGHTNPQIVAALKRLSFKTSTRSLQRFLKSWGLRRPSGATGVRNNVSDELAEAVNYLFHHTTLNDTQLAARCLTYYQLQTTARQVRSIRSIFGWLRRSKDAASDAQSTSTHQQVAHLLNGPGRTFGREWLTTYLRVHHGYKARRLDVSIAQRALDPEGVAQRQPGLRRPRLENYVTSGPNFLWCLDGHDKLAQYGMQIYAAVDAYSRKIIWFYCGNSNRTAISVVRQYFNAVKAIGLCPRFIRTDKGTETFLLCDIHFSLFIEAELREGLSNESYQSLRISDCYIYFTSKMVIVCALFHSALAPNTSCPFCHHSNDPYGGPSGVAGTPDPSNQAQYTLVVPGTVSALRQTIDTGNAYRAAKAAAVSPILPTPGTPQPLSMTRFHVRVAHAYYSESTPLGRYGPSSQTAGS